MQLRLACRFPRPVRMRANPLRNAWRPRAKENRLCQVQAKGFGVELRPVHVVLVIPAQISGNRYDQRQHRDVNCQGTKERPELRAPLGHDALEEFQLLKCGRRRVTLDDDTESQVSSPF